MTDSDPDEALVRSAFRDFQAGVPSPAPDRLATAESKIRRRRAAGLAGAAVLVTALVVTPAIIARGEPAGTLPDPGGVPLTQATDPSDAPDTQPPLTACSSKSPRDGVDLAVTATDLFMGPVHGAQPNTRRRGDMVVKVCNAGRAAAPAGKLTLRWLARIPPDVAMGSGSWKDCGYGDQEQEGGVAYSVVHCAYPELPPGSAREYMFLFEMAGGDDPAFGRTLGQYAEASAAGDVNARNNRAAFKTKEADAVGSVGQPAQPSCTSKTRSQGADLALVATALTLGPAPQGNEPRRGDIAITVCNNGRAAAPAGTLTVRWLGTIPPDVQMGTGSWEDCRYGDQERERGITYSVAHCTYPALAAGSSRQHMFLFEIPGGADPGIDRPVAQYARVSDTGDTNTRNNKTTFKIATV